MCIFEEEHQQPHCKKLKNSTRHSVAYSEVIVLASSFLFMAFLANSYPAKFMAPRGAIQKNLGTAPLNKPRGPSWRRIEMATKVIDTDRPCAVIILVFMTSNGVVTTAARPPDKAPTAIVSQASSSLPSSFWTPYIIHDNIPLHGEKYINMKLK